MTIRSILYLSCHSVLAYDECKLLTELGYYVFCPNSFVEKLNPGDDSIRPQIEVLPQFLTKYREDMAEFHKLGKPGIDNKELLTKDFIDRFDAIIVMHLPKWIHKNWDAMKHKVVILREIGQSVEHNENELRPYKSQGMKIVRYSPREEKVPGYNGSDALIRFYKDPVEFANWNGEEKFAVSCVQSMEKRGRPCNFEWFEQATRPFPRKLYGADSENQKWGMGKVPFDDLKAAMRDNRVYVYTGTWPASYTLNFIEAFMTGIPIVAIGPELGHPYGWFGRNHPLYEIGDIIQNGVNGFCSDSLADAQNNIRDLFNDYELAKKIGSAGRETAIKLFGKDVVKNQWDVFLKSI